MSVIKKMLSISVMTAVICTMAATGRAQNGTYSYITNHKTMAVLLSHAYGIPAPLILAVAQVESSGGKGPAARVLNNHFGIVGKNDYRTPSGFKSRYKQYPNEIASYIDFCRMITRKRFYHRLKNKMNCTAWVKAMSAAHYSEVPEEWEQKVFTALSMVRHEARKETSMLLAIK